MDDLGGYRRKTDKGKTLVFVAVAVLAVVAAIIAMFWLRKPKVVSPVTEDEGVRVIFVTPALNIIETPLPSVLTSVNPVQKASPKTAPKATPKLSPQVSTTVSASPKD